MRVVEEEFLRLTRTLGKSSPPKIACTTALLAVLCLAIAARVSVAVAQETPRSVFELDCVSFAGRFLSSAPVKKRAQPGLAVDGTAWSWSADSKQVIINKIFPGESAANEGVEPGDEVIAVNGYPTEGRTLLDVFAAYHMYDPVKLTETLTLKKKADSTTKTVKLQVVPIDAANAEEKQSWLQHYKGLGY
jgi:hypothetical protein